MTSFPFLRNGGITYVGQMTPLVYSAGRADPGHTPAQPLTSPAARFVTREYPAGLLRRCPSDLSTANPFGLVLNFPLSESQSVPFGVWLPLLNVKCASGAGSFSLLYSTPPFLSAGAVCPLAPLMRLLWAFLGKAVEWTDVFLGECRREVLGMGTVCLPLWSLTAKARRFLR